MQFNRILKTLFALFLGIGQEFIFQIMSTILWIRFWGAEFYSEWLMISLLPTLIVRGNTGIFHGATSELIREYKQEHFALASQTYHSLQIAQYVFLAVIGIFYCVALLIIDRFIESRIFSTIDLIIIGALFFIQFGLFQWQQSLLSLARADGKTPSAALWQNHFRSAHIFCFLLGSIFTGPMWCLTATVISQFLVVLLTHRYARPSTDKIKNLESTATRHKVIFLINKGLHFAVFPFGQAALHTVSVWLISFFWGELIGAAYHNMRTISRSLVLFSRAGETAIRLELSELFAHNKIGQAVKLVSRAIILALAICSIIVICLMLAGSPVFTFLTKGELQFSQGTYVILCAGALIYAMSLVYLAVPFSLNKHNLVAKTYFIIVAISLAFAWISSSYGIQWVATVMLLSDIAVLIFARRTALKILA